MTKENVEGMVRTALTTHHAKYGIMPPEPNELVSRIADAVIAQQEIDAAVRLGEAQSALDAALKVGSAVGPRPDDM